MSLQTNTRYFDALFGEPNSDVSTWREQLIRFPASNIRDFLQKRFNNNDLRDVSPVAFRELVCVVEYKLVKRKGRTVFIFKELKRYDRGVIERIFSTQKWLPNE